jgi:hypothetical protein
MANSLEQSSAPHVYHRFANASLERATEEVVNGQLTVTQAAHIYGVPHSTLQIHVQKANENGGHYTAHKPGPQPVLSEDDEAWLSVVLKAWTKNGYEMHESEIRNFAAKIFWSRGLARGKGHVFAATHSWFEGFLERHPEIVVIRNTPDGSKSYKGRNFTAIAKTLEQVDATMQRYNIPLSNVWTMDEIGIPRRIAAVKRKNHNEQHQHQDKRHMVMMAACSAAGQSIPPVYIVNLKKHVRATDLDDAPVGSGIFHTESGVLTGSCFLEWMKFFHQHIPNNGQQRLLILDDSRPHIFKAATDYALSQGTHIVWYDAAASDLISPLQLGVFEPFGEFMKIIHDEQYPVGISRRRDQIGSTTIPFIRAFSSINILSGFEHAGITIPAKLESSRKAIQDRLNRVLSPEDNDVSDEEKARIEHRRIEEFELKHDHLVTTTEVMTSQQLHDSIASLQKENKRNIGEMETEIPAGPEKKMIRSS